MIFYQLFEKNTSTYTYLLGDPDTREAVLIDPVNETMDRDLKLIDELDLKLKFVLETHVHADHITSSGEIRKKTGALIGLSSVYSTSCPDLQLDEKSEIQFGKYIIHVLHTPGHTAGCLTYQLEDMLFTGDALLVRGCGRTDFQGGSSEVLYDSVRNKIFSHANTIMVYPAHDYFGHTHTTLGEEKKFNPRLNLRIEKNEFVAIMANLNLSLPLKIQESVPANLKCGVGSLL